MSYNASDFGLSIEGQLPSTKPAVFWCGEIGDCQACGRSFDGVMFDANTGQGWGNICSKCFEGFGCSLGVGRGQKYEQQADGRWLLVAGGST